MTTIDWQTTLQATPDRAWQVVRTMVSTSRLITYVLHERLIVAKFRSVYTVFLLTPSDDSRSVTLRYVVTDADGALALRANLASLHKVIGKVAVELTDSRSALLESEWRQIRRIGQTIENQNKTLATPRQRLAAALLDLELLIFAALMSGILIPLVGGPLLTGEPDNEILLILTVAIVGLFISTITAYVARLVRDAWPRLAQSIDRWWPRQVEVVKVQWPPKERVAEEGTLLNILVSSFIWTLWTLMVLSHTFVRLPTAIADLTALAAVAAYYILCSAFGGQTPGKKLLRLRVVAVDGSPVGLGKATMRLLGSWLSVLSFGFGYVWILFDKNHQAGHDKIAGTLVVRDEDYPLSATAPGVDRAQLRDNRRQWLVGLALVSSLVLAKLVLPVHHDLRDPLLVGVSLRDTVTPSELVRVDLNRLGLARGEVIDARMVDSAWTDGRYTSGAVAYYGDGEDHKDVAVWVLRYDSTESAAQDFGANGLFGAYYATTGTPSGQTSESFSFLLGHGTRKYEDSEVSGEIYWNGTWIVHIFVVVSRDRPSGEFVDQVRQAVIDQWAERAGGAA